MARKHRYAHTEVQIDLADRIALYGVARTARQLGFSKQYVWNVSRGLKDIGPRFAKAMGYNRIVEYERI